MNILVACEESQAVTIELRNLGHNAFSCDLQECSGGHPEWHTQADALKLINGNCSFKTMDGVRHRQNGKWDMLIAFPPCTHLAGSGAAWFEKKRENGLQRFGVWFFSQFLKADCDRIAIENPVGIMGGGGYISMYYNDLHIKYGVPVPYSQQIQPYEFGSHARKATCLWLKNLPPLKATNVVDPGLIDKNGHSYGAAATYATDENGKVLPWNDPMTAKIRSKTYPGIAKAMATQWTTEEAMNYRSPFGGDSFSGRKYEPCPGFQYELDL